MTDSNLQPSISVIVPVYNGGEDFHSCLKHLLAIKSRVKEIIVVADGDTDGSRELAEKFGLKVIANSSPQGPAQARNQGARIATSDIILFIDADIDVCPDIISKVEKCFLEDPDLTAIFGSYDDKPGKTNFLSQYKNLLHHFTHQTSNTNATTFWSGCGAIKRDVFIEFQGFSKIYQMPSIEDIELGYRLTSQGHKIYLDKSLQVKHLKRWGVISLIKTDFFQRALPWSKLILTGRVFINDLNLNYASRLSVMLVFILLASFLSIIPILLFDTFYLYFLIVIMLACSLGLTILNISVYKFFLNKRGIIFTLKVIPWHWLYYFYSGIAFLIAILEVRLLPLVTKKPSEATNN